MNSERLTVSPRNQNLTARQIRRRGFVPGVVYGLQQNAVPIEVDGKSLVQMIKKIGESVLFEIAMEDRVDAVRIREIQRDPVTRDIIHVDMQRVDANEKIQTDVPLKFEGLHNGGNRGAVIQFQKNSVKVEGYAKDIPSFIRVSIKDLKPGQGFHVHDLEVSEELSIIDNANELILTAVKSSDYENTQEQETADSNMEDTARS